MCRTPALRVAIFVPGFSRIFSAAHETLAISQTVTLAAAEDLVSSATHTRESIGFDTQYTVKLVTIMVQEILGVMEVD